MTHAHAHTHTHTHTHTHAHTHAHTHIHTHTHTHTYTQTHKIQLSNTTHTYTYMYICTHTYTHTYTYTTHNSATQHPHTHTHMQVPNFIPSISAVMGGHTPERYIWRLLMALFSFPRLFDGLLYYNFFSLSLSNRMTWYRWLNRTVLFLHLWQYVSLFQLSYISSKENFSKQRISRTVMLQLCACALFS